MYHHLSLSFFEKIRLPDIPKDIPRHIPIPIPAMLFKTFIKTVYSDNTFNENMEQMHENQIYIHTYKGRSDGEWGDIYIAINILIPLTYEKLANFGEKRSFAIATEIEDMFQDICVAEDNAEEYLIDKLGNLKFKVVQFDNGRLSKTNNIILNTIVLKTGVTVDRIGDDR